MHTLVKFVHTLHYLLNISRLCVSVCSVCKISNFYYFSIYPIFELCSKIFTFGNSQINLEFRSICTIFELHSKIGCISEMKINQDLFCISLDLHYLCSDDTLHSIATPAAVAQKHVRLCAYLLQQQSVEARLFLAHARSVCIILPDFEFYLLLQRSEGCRG